MEQKLPHISTHPYVFAVRVEWRWPDNYFWFGRVELQYVRENRIPIVEIIEWPVVAKVISGLRAGEKIHVRMRPLDKDGNGPAWNASDWLEGASSSDTQDIVQHVQDSLAASSPLLNMNYETEEPGKNHSAGMKVGIEGNQQQVKFLADRFAVTFGIQLRTPEEVREIEEYLKRQRLAKSMRDALEELSPFTVSYGQVFIQEAFFKGGEIQATNIEPVVEDKAKQESTRSEPKNNISINIHSVAPDSDAASDSVSKAVNERINLMLKPGGTIWRAMNKC